MPLSRRRGGPVGVTELSQSPLYSRNCQDALRILDVLAAAALRRRGSVRKLDAIAAETGMAQPTVSQALYFLRLAGLVERPSPQGVRLARPAAQISLLDVVRATDGAGLLRGCLMGLAACSDAAPCPVHPVWKKARGVLEQHLEDQSIADLARALALKRSAGRSRRLRRR